MAKCLQPVLPVFCLSCGGYRLDGFGKLSGTGDRMRAGAPSGWERKHPSMVKQIPNNIGVHFLVFVCLFNTETEGNDVTSCPASGDCEGRTADSEIFPFFSVEESISQWVGEDFSHWASGR